MYYSNNNITERVAENEDQNRLDQCKNGPCGVSHVHPVNKKITVSFWGNRNRIPLQGFSIFLRFAQKPREVHVT